MSRCFFQLDALYFDLLCDVRSLGVTLCYVSPEESKTEIVHYVSSLGEGGGGGREGGIAHVMGDEVIVFPLLKYVPAKILRYHITQTLYPNPASPAASQITRVHTHT